MDMSQKLATQAVTLLTHLFSNPNTTAHTMTGAERFDPNNMNRRTADPMHADMTGSTTAQMAQSSMNRPSTMTYDDTSANRMQTAHTTGTAAQSTSASQGVVGQVMDAVRNNNLGDHLRTGATAIFSSGVGMMLAEKVLSWVKGHLTSSDDRKALQDLQQEPDSHVNQKALINRIDDYLVKQPQAATALNNLFSQSGISQQQLDAAAEDIGGGVMANIGAGIKNMFS